MKIYADHAGAKTCTADIGSWMSYVHGRLKDLQYLHKLFFHNLVGICGDNLESVITKKTGVAFWRTYRRMVELVKLQGGDVGPIGCMLSIG